MLLDPKREAEIEIEIKVAKEPWRRLLLNAADYLEQHGHCHGAWEDLHGRRCALGAIAAVTIDSERPGDDYSETCAGLRRLIDEPIAPWNDRTPSEGVIAIMRLAARS